MLEPNVVDGVHRVEDAYTNWFIVEGGDGLTVVDAGVPTSWASLQQALQALGRRLDDVAALVLTHAHFDHLGFAERLRRETGVPVYVHENDVPLTRHPLQYAHERPRSFYFATQVDALPIVASLVRNRAFWPPPVARCGGSPTGTSTCPADRCEIALGVRGRRAGDEPRAVSWAAFARRGAGVSTRRLRECRLAELGLPAPRPRYSVLGSDRGRLLPPLEDALARYVAGRP